MKHRDFLRASQDAARSLAETAITTPHLFPEYAVWQGRLKELERVKAHLAEAEARWFARLQPAMVDPLLRKLAEQRGLLPSIYVCLMRQLDEDRL